VGGSPDPQRNQIPKGMTLPNAYLLRCTRRSSFRRTDVRLNPHDSRALYINIWQRHPLANKEIEFFKNINVYLIIFSAECR
jgi:hypothetical protein